MRHPPRNDPLGPRASAPRIVSRRQSLEAAPNISRKETHENAPTTSPHCPLTRKTRNLSGDRHRTRARSAIVAEPDQENATGTATSRGRNARPRRDSAPPQRRHHLVSRHHHENQTRRPAQRRHLSGQHAQPRRRSCPPRLSIRACRSRDHLRHKQTRQSSGTDNGATHGAPSTAQPTQQQNLAQTAARIAAQIDDTQTKLDAVNNKQLASAPARQTKRISRHNATNSRDFSRLNKALQDTIQKMAAFVGGASEGAEGSRRRHRRTRTLRSRSPRRREHQGNRSAQLQRRSPQTQSRLP